MRTNYAAKRNTGRPHRRWLILGAVLILMVGGSLQYIYVAKHHPERLAQFSEQVSGFRHWFVDRKARLQTGLDKKLTDIKTLSAKKTEDEEVHFEFYTALPAMQMSVAEANLETKAPASAGVVTDDKKKPAATLSPMKSLAAKSLFLDPAELEQDFAKRFTQQTYVIQLGVFSTAAAAEAFKEKLSSERYSAAVVKAYVGERHVYRVQLGPFASKDQVETAQHDLRKKGIDGIVRKIG